MRTRAVLLTALLCTALAIPAVPARALPARPDPRPRPLHLDEWPRMEWSPSHDQDVTGGVQVSGDRGETVSVDVLDGAGRTVLPLGSVTLPRSGRRTLPFPVADYCPGTYRLRATSRTSPSRVVGGSIEVYAQRGSDPCTTLSPYSPGAAPGLGLDVDADSEDVFPDPDGFLDTVQLEPSVSRIHGIADPKAVDARLQVQVGDVVTTTPLSALREGRWTPRGLPYGTARAWLTATAPDGTELRSNAVTFRLRPTALSRLRVQASDIEPRPWTDTRNRTDIVVYDAAFEADDHDVDPTNALRLTGSIAVYGPGSSTPLTTFRYRSARTCRVGFSQGGGCPQRLDPRLQFVPAAHGRYVGGTYRVVATVRAQEGRTLSATTTFHVPDAPVLSTARVR